MRRIRLNLWMNECMPLLLMLKKGEAPLLRPTATSSLYYPSPFEIMLLVSGSAPKGDKGSRSTSASSCSGSAALSTAVRERLSGFIRERSLLNESTKYLSANDREALSSQYSSDHQVKAVLPETTDKTSLDPNVLDLCSLIAENLGIVIRSKCQPQH